MIGVHPQEGHDIPGVRSIVQLRQTALYRPEQYDQTLEVSDGEAYEMCLRLNREDSIIAGPSSGMALVGALKSVPDQPGTIVVVMFPDNIFKYASSMQRHFPQICPGDEQAANAGPTPDEEFLAQVLDNLKNSHDSIRVKELSAMLEGGETPLLVDVRPPDMFADGHIASAINIPKSELADHAAELPEDRDAAIMMVCNIRQDVEVHDVASQIARISQRAHRQRRNDRVDSQRTPDRIEQGGDVVDVGRCVTSTSTGSASEHSRLADDP